MGLEESEIMKCELRVNLPSDTPVVGCEINPYVSFHCKGSLEIPEHSMKFNWYRLQSDDKVICCVHDSKIATFQCMCCVTLKLPVKESYHCSAKCFFDTWPIHRARHFEAAGTTNKTFNGDNLVSGELGTCGSWPSVGSWSGFGYGPVHNRTAITVKGEDVSWLKVGSSNTYVPSRDDFGYILMLESVAVDCKQGNPLAPVHYIVTDRVINAPVPRPRGMIQIGPLEGCRNFRLETPSSVAGTFSVLSYNILSDLYATQTMFSYCPTWALTWEYRRENLLREITRYKADILCLQEVQSDHFENFFEPELVQRGYSVIYKKRKTEMYTRNRFSIDGCAIFFRKDRFREIKKYELEFSKIAHSIVEEHNPNQKTEAHVRLKKDNVAIAVILELMGNGAVSDALDYRFCVANTHIHANTKYTDVKLWQVATLINGLEKIVDSHIPVVICGDLNSRPGSAPHDLLVMGKVDPSHNDLAVDPVGIFQHLKLSHTLPLESAYSSLLRTVGDDSNLEQQRKMINPQTKEPLFTNFTEKFSGAIDYIFYTADRMMVKGLLELLDMDSAMRYTALPSPEWSSDHIALMADFCLEPTIRHPANPPLPVCLW